MNGRRKCLVIGPYGSPGTETRKWSEWVVKEQHSPPPLTEAALLLAHLPRLGKSGREYPDCPCLYFKGLPNYLSQPFS